MAGPIPNIVTDFMNRRTTKKGNKRRKTKSKRKQDSSEEKMRVLAKTWARRIRDSRRYNGGPLLKAAPAHKARLARASVTETEHRAPRTVTTLPSATPREEKQRKRK